MKRWIGVEGQLYLYHTDSSIEIVSVKEFKRRNVTESVEYCTFLWVLGFLVNLCKEHPEFLRKVLSDFLVSFGESVEHHSMFLQLK